jgi:hypothetical protein
MLNLLKRVALAGTVVWSLVASAITPALATTPTAILTFNPTTTSFDAGTSFTVPVQINLQNGGSLGDQFGITYDPAVLTLNSATDGDWFANYAATQPGQPNPNQNCAAKHDQDWTPPFPAGVSQIGGDHLQGVCGAGASGVGTVVTLNFTAAAGVNTSTSLNLTPSDSTGLHTVVNGVIYQNVTVSPITLSIGTSASTATPTGTSTATPTPIDTATPVPTDISTSTATPTPTATTVSFGDADVEGSTRGILEGRAQAFPYVASEAGIVTHLNVYVDQRNFALGYEVGVYDNTFDNHPGSLLVGRELIYPVSGQWNTVTIPPVAVDAGRTYWIAVLSGPRALAIRVTTFGGIAETSAEMTLTRLPATWTTGHTLSSAPASVYASP